MKSIYELETWLKGNDSRTFSASVSGGKYTVIMSRTSFTSKTLPGAIEGCLEELRRKDSGMDSMKDSAKVYTNAVYTNSQIKLSGAPITVTSACGTITATGGTCPQCNLLPWDWDHMNSRFKCASLTCPDWPHSPQNGVKYVFRGVGSHVWNSKLKGWMASP